MQHTLKMTAALARYMDRPEPITLPAKPTEDNVPEWIEKARSRAVEMYKIYQISKANQSRFWAVVPGYTSAREDAEFVSRFCKLLGEEGDFDKALVRFADSLR